MVDTPGPDLIGLIVGSEGTLAVVDQGGRPHPAAPESVQTLLAAFDSISDGGRGGVGRSSAPASFPPPSR